MSTDFLKGAYFLYVLQSDARFADVAILFGGASEKILDANRAALAGLHSLGSQSEEVTLVGTRGLGAIAQLLTIWTVLIELLLTVAFLAPPGSPPGRVRNALLLLFGWTTYIVATVPTFGLVLMALGVAQCEPGQRRTRFLYVLGYVAILLYAYVPVLTIVRAIVGR